MLGGLALTFFLTCASDIPKEKETELLNIFVAETSERQKTVYFKI